MKIFMPIEISVKEKKENLRLESQKPLRFLNEEFMSVLHHTGFDFIGSAYP